jgi:predicted nucleic acid-binding protein
MKISADTNVLVRAVVGDDPAQSQAAIAALRGAEQIAVALPALCKFVWVLRRVCAFPGAEIIAAIQALMAAGNVSIV